VSESTLSATPVKSTRSKVVLTDTPQFIPRRRARAIVRKAAYVAIYVTMGEYGASDLMDVSKRRVLRMLRRYEKVWVSELFGRIIIGRPCPV
jgi:hypothetical protein